MGNRASHAASRESTDPIPALRPQSSSVSLSRLATVEHQLIMRCLPSREIVQLARCSRSLMHAAADSPIAFQLAEPIRRPFPPRSRATRITSHCLAPFILQWALPTAAGRVTGAVDSLIQSLEAAPADRLHGLDAEDNVAWISEAQWKRILSCPAVQSIRFLALPRSRSYLHAVSAELVAMLSGLPLLSTLRIGDSDHPGADESCALSRLSEFPSLTSFDSSAYYHTWPPVALRSVARCRLLTSLGITASTLGTEGPSLLSGLERSPVLLTLVRFRVEWCYFTQQSLEPFFSVISQMSRLRELTLVFSSELQRVYAQLPSITSRHPLPASLETICIQPDLGMADYQGLHDLGQMLAALPRLRLVLRLEAHFTSTTKGRDLRVATSFRTLYETSPELAAVRAAGRLRVDWRLRS